MKIIVSREELVYMVEKVDNIKEKILKSGNDIDLIDLELLDSLKESLNSNPDKEEFILDIPSDIFKNIIDLYNNIYEESLPLVNKIIQFVNYVLKDNNPILNIIDTLIKPLLPEGLLDDITNFMSYVKDQLNICTEKCNKIHYPNE